MCLRSMQVQNFTVFDEEDIAFSKGINVIVGPDGVGKTHLLKLLYAASQAADPKVSFPQKVVRCFLPDDDRIARLVRKQQGAGTAKVRVPFYGRGESEGASVSMCFDHRTSRWDADVQGETGWEQQLSGMTGVSVPQLSIRYDLQLGLLSLPKSTHKDHMIQNADVDFMISDEDMEKLKQVPEIQSL